MVHSHTNLRIQTYWTYSWIMPGSLKTVWYSPELRSTPLSDARMLGASVLGWLGIRVT